MRISYFKIQFNSQFSILTIHPKWFYQLKFLKLKYFLDKDLIIKSFFY